MCARIGGMGRGDAAADTSDLTDWEMARYFELV